ncbi:DUF3795 domain-containing protein [Candidatus Bathyarchaeota archaeon]|nr:DUF3795 domain-containing protein [Candidatus Bathyarchaeota archaeon]
MPNLVSKCGMDCGACPWGPYPRKEMTAKDFEQYRNDAKRILGYMPIKTPCVTCQTPDSEIPKESRLPNRKCLIRRCVDKTGVPNCAYCASFPCDTLKATAGAWNRESIEAKLGAPISEEAYHSFVEPFEGIKRLEAIRASLKPDEIVEPAKIPTSETRIADFPRNLPFSKEETASFKAVHNLLANLARSSLGLRGTDTFAQQHKLENQRAHVSRFLWLLGNYGKFEKETGTSLVVDAETYIDNRGSEKTLAIWSFVEDTVFKVLSEFGVCCERVALEGVDSDDLTTGTGYLRKKGWVLQMSFEEKVGSAATLKALQTYVQRLDNRYGARAFQRFRDADMQILLEP